MMGTTWGGDNMGWRPRRQQETTETTAMGTTWGPSGHYGDDVGMTRTMQGRHGDDRDDMGMMGTTWGPWGQQNH